MSFTVLLEGDHMQYDNFGGDCPAAVTMYGFFSEHLPAAVLQKVNVHFYRIVQS